jgi:hypothetical protein
MVSKLIAEFKVNKEALIEVSTQGEMSALQSADYKVGAASRGSRWLAAL